MLRPRASVFRQGVLASAAFLAPVFVVLYFMTIPAGPWLVVLVTQLVATVLVAMGAVGYYGTEIRLTPGNIAERGFFGAHRKHLTTDIGSILMIPLFVNNDDPIVQLFLRDHDGRLLLRMRGQFWTHDSMLAVVEASGVRPTETTHPVSVAELRRESPELLYWFERLPALAGTAFALLVGGAGGLMLLVLHLLGHL